MSLTQRLIHSLSGYQHRLYISGSSSGGIIFKSLYFSGFEERCYNAPFLTSNNTEAWEKHLWFEEITLVLNLISGSGMGKAVPYEADFPGAEVQKVIVVWTMTFLGL